MATIAWSHHCTGSGFCRGPRPCFARRQACCGVSSENASMKCSRAFVIISAVATRVRPARASSFVSGGGASGSSSVAGPAVRRASISAGDRDRGGAMGTATGGGVGGLSLASVQLASATCCASECTVSWMLAAAAASCFARTAATASTRTFSVRAASGARWNGVCCPWLLSILRNRATSPSARGLPSGVGDWSAAMVKRWQCARAQHTARWIHCLPLELLHSAHKLATDIHGNPKRSVASL